MAITFEQLGLLFMFILFGFFLGKSGLIKCEHSKILSTLEVYLFLPCTLFNTMYNNFSVSNITQYYLLMVVSAVTLVTLALCTSGIAKMLSKDAYERNVYKYSLVVSNYGYMGYALAQGLFGAEGLLNMIFFALPFSFYTYTFGYCMLTNRKLSFKRLLNPILLSILVGAILRLVNLPLPGILTTFTTKAASCMAPVSMLLTGLTISEFNVKNLITDKKVYIASIIRLVVIPCVVMLVLKQFASDTIVRTAVLLCAMPCGLNTIVFPKLIDMDYKTGAKLAFVSNIIAIISVPVVLNFI